MFLKGKALSWGERSPELVSKLTGQWADDDVAHPKHLRSKSS